MEQPLYVVTYFEYIHITGAVLIDIYIYTLIYNVYQQIDEMSPEATANTLARYYIVVLIVYADGNSPSYAKYPVYAHCVTLVQCNHMSPEATASSYGELYIVVSELISIVITVMVAVTYARGSLIPTQPVYMVKSKTYRNGTNRNDITEFSNHL